jgi:hypothetical protein
MSILSKASGSKHDFGLDSKRWRAYQAIQLCGELESKLA